MFAEPRWWQAKPITEKSVLAEGMLDRLNSLWIGEQLGYVERLTMVSALSVGHPFTLYSYTPEK
ncbi:hypothetical protein, partial [Roseiarcus sp.]|uniref:hypothetical protein n=1 Tax=Roseiarcus sp. TaxID=1969460 RepID=UPI003F988498